MLVIILILFFCIVLLYKYNTRNFDYWLKREVKHDTPVIFFGTNVKNFIMQQSRSETIADMYWKYPEEKVIGGFRGPKPELVVRDPNLIKQVLVTDFSHFYLRGLHPNKHAIEPCMRMVPFAEGDEWKMLRKVVVPSFSSSKMRAAFPLILNAAKKLQSNALNTKRDEPTDALDLTARYVIDLSVNSGFGLGADEVLKTEDNEFTKLDSAFFNFGLTDFITTILKDVFPTLCKDLKYFGKLEKKFFTLVEQIKKKRGYQPSDRNDFVDQMLQYRQKGFIEINSLERRLLNGVPEKVTLEFDDTLCDVQIMLFAAGFGTSSHTVGYTLHQLAYHPEMQKKVQEEIDEVLAKHDNDLTYDAVKELKYLEWTFKESMRQFPALGILTRECTRKYTFSDVNLTIDEGVRIMIPVKALHMDPKYWDDPEEFRPERFHPDNFTAKQKLAYLPFGDGPRNCLGSRLGMTISLVAIAAILSRVTVAPAPNSVRCPGVDPIFEIVQSPKGRTLPLIFRKRK